MTNQEHTERELLDSDGENRAVRTFLQLYGGTNSPSIEGMRDHLAMSGFDGYWPDWVNDPANSGHLTKGGAQDWLRYLFSLEDAAGRAAAGKDREDAERALRVVREWALFDIRHGDSKALDPKHVLNLCNKALKIDAAKGRSGT